MVKKAASAPAPEPTAPIEQQPAAPAPEPTAPVADDPPPAPPVEVEPLASYAARIEELAQPLPVCQITHPDAVDGAVHVGKYAGIRLVRGDKVEALLSSGKTL